MTKTKGTLLRMMFILALMLGMMLAMTVTAHAMQIFVETPAEGTITLEVESSDSIENVKEKIKDRTEISIDRQTLSYGGQSLENNQTLAYYNIKKESILALTVAPQGNLITDAEIRKPDVQYYRNNYYVLTEGTWYIDDDTDLEYGVFVESGPVTINLMGYTLSCQRSSVICVANSTLTVNNGVITGGSGNQEIRIWDNSRGGGLAIDFGSTVTLNNIVTQTSHVENNR